MVSDKGIAVPAAWTLNWGTANAADHQLFTNKSFLCISHKASLAIQAPDQGSQDPVVRLERNFKRNETKC